MQELVTHEKAQASASANEELDLDELMDVSWKFNLSSGLYIYFISVVLTYHILPVMIGS